LNIKLLYKLYTLIWYNNYDVYFIILFYFIFLFNWLFHNIKICIV